MADDGVNAVATLRFSSRQRSKHMLLEEFKIVAQRNGVVSEPSHFLCQGCDQSFPNLITLQSHERVCSGQELDSLGNKGSTSINRRSKAPPRKLNVETHSRAEEADDEAVISEVNNNVSPLSSSVGQPVDVDVEDLNDNPDIQSVNQEQLDPNAATAVIDGPCYCDLCHKTFSGIFALKAHNYYYHSSVRRTFSCKLCPRQFKWEAILKRHTNIVHGRRERRQNPALNVESLAARDQPATIGETRAQLSANIELTGSGDGYKCNTCNKVFGSLSAVRLHRFSAHGTGPRQVCKFCNKSYRPCHFARHCCWDNKAGRRRRAAPVVEETAPPPVDVDCVTLKCVLCQGDFSDFHLLKEHLVHVHQVNQREKLDELLASGSDFTGEDEEEPLSLTSGTSNASSSQRRAECPVCHKVFKNRGSLGMHRWRHHSLQKRFCTGCRKSYLASQFSSHICSFSSDNELNNGGSIQCANLSSSLASSSPNAPATSSSSKCDMCNRQYANDHSLKDHMRVVHGVYQRITKSSTITTTTTAKQTTTIDGELHSDNAAPSSSIAARPSSSTGSGALALGSNNSYSNNITTTSSSSNNNNNNNNTSPSLLAAESDQWIASFPLRHRQATPLVAGTSASPPTLTDATAAAIANTSPSLIAKTTHDSASSAMPAVGDCECVTCHRVFKNSSALRLHRFSAHGACPRRMCSKCNKSFLPWHYLRHACAGNGGAGLGGEPITEDSFAASSHNGGGSAATNEIISSYPPPVEWQCTMCERRYLSRRTLKDHLRVVHGVYQRRNLDAFMPSVQNQQQHLQQQPFKQNHPTVVNEASSESSSGVLDLSCPPDAKRMRMAESSELSSQSNGSSLVMNLSKSGQVALKSYKCGICYKLFRDIAALRKHRYSAHGTCPKKMCPRCKKFLLPWHVKRHCCWSSAGGSSSNNNNNGSANNGHDPASTPISDEHNGTGDDAQQQVNQQQHQQGEDVTQPKCDLCQRRYANDHTLKCHLRVIHGVYQRQKSSDGGFAAGAGASSAVAPGAGATEDGDQKLLQSPDLPGAVAAGPGQTTPEKRAKMPLNLNGNECGVCHKVFQSHGAARLHLFSAHGACPKRHCTTCNKWYLPWHYSRHFCQNVAAQAAQAATLAANGPPEDGEIGTEQLQQSPWKCESCDRQYLSHRTLKDHLRIAHGIYQTRRPSSAVGATSNNNVNNNNELAASPSHSPTPQVKESPSKPTPATPSASEPKPNPGITVIGDPSSPLYECDICSKVFKSSSAARLHRLSGHGACPKKTCPNCKRTFLPCHFARHSCTAVAQVAPLTAPSTATAAVVSSTTGNGGGLEWKCHLCDRRYQSSRTLKDHLRIGHGVYQTRKNGELSDNNVASEPRPRGASLSPSALPSDDINPEEGNNNNGSELQQLLASTNVTSPSAVNNQGASSAVGSNGNENECDICHKSFKNSSALRLHRYVTHVSRRRQLCTRCNKSFLPCHFPRHCCWSTQNGEQPPKRSANNNNNLNKHQESAPPVAHENVPSNYRCEFCPNRFANEAMLKTHLELEHGIFDFAPEDVNGFKAEQNELIAEPPPSQSPNDNEMMDEEGNDDDMVEIDNGANGNAAGSSNTPSNGYKCGICHMPFSNLTDVRKHRYSTHGACPKRICPKCNKAILPCHFSRHSCDPIGTATNSVNVTVDVQQQPPEPLTEEAAFEWKCDLCDRRYLCRRTLNDHRRIVHGLYQRRPVNGEKGSDQQQQQHDDPYDSAGEMQNYGGPEMAPESDEEVKVEVEEAPEPEPVVHLPQLQPPPAHSGPASRSLMVFPEPEGFYADFLAFKQPKMTAEVEANAEEMSFEDPLAMMDVGGGGADEAGGPSDVDGSGSSPQDNNAGTEQCTICLKTFKSSSALRLHRFSAHGTCPKKECPKCNKSFLPWHFTRHCCWNKDDEQAGTSEALAANEVDSATCDLCRRSYTSARTLKEHMRTVHGVYQRRVQPATLVPQPVATAIAQQTVVERPPSSASSSVPVATPSACEEENVAVKNEPSSSNTSSQQRYVCPDCNASFNAPFDLLLHRLAHTGDKPFVCPDCKEAFAMPQELDVHRSTVHQ